MQGWKTTGWTAVCGIGALSFLRIVACEIERTNRKLARIDEQAAKAHALRTTDKAPIAVAASSEASAATPWNGRNSEFIARSPG